MRSFLAGACLLALVTCPSLAEAKSKLEARLDSSGAVVYVQTGKASSSGTVAPVKVVYWGSNPQTAQPLRDGQRVNVCPKRPRK